MIPHQKYCVFQQDINRVDLWKSLPYAARAAQVSLQVRIGDLDVGNYPRRQIIYNTACGDTLPTAANNFPYTSFFCTPALSGRYLTVQVMVSIHLELAEIDVYTESKTCNSLEMSMLLL